MTDTVGIKQGRGSLRAAHLHALNLKLAAQSLLLDFETALPVCEAHIARRGDGVVQQRERLVVCCLQPSKLQRAWRSRNRNQPARDHSGGRAHALLRLSLIRTYDTAKHRQPLTQILAVAGESESTRWPMQMWGMPQGQCTHAAPLKHEVVLALT